MPTDRLCPSCRATRLSLYNRDPLCAACLRATRDPAALIPVWLWDSAPMRQALARTDVGAMVAILRAVAGLSQLELANLVDGWSQSLVSLIERGHRDTLYDIRELLRFADAIDMPREALLPLVLGDPHATLGADSDTELLGVGVDQGRRSFTRMVAGWAASVALPSIQVPARSDIAHVRYLRTCLDRLRSSDQRLGGGAVLRQALHQFAHAKAMLDDSDYSEAIGRQLIAVAADLGNLAGFLAYDADHQPLARHMYREAELLASSADDVEPLIHVYLNMAQQSLHWARVSGRRGLAREALRFAGHAAENARHMPSPRLHALIAARHGLAHAQLGDEIAFRKEIIGARRELDRGPHSADQTWSDYVTESEVTGYEAMGYLQLGIPPRAVSLYRDVINDVSRAHRDHAYYRALLAGALLETGDRMRAVEEGLPILPDLVDGQLTSIRTLNVLRPVRTAAERLRAAEFIERFDAAERALTA